MTSDAGKTASPYIAVASDMDGTLLQPDHRMSEYTRRVLRCVQEERQIPVIFATGRHHSDVLATKKKLRLEGYVITSNGARVHDPKGEVLIRCDMEPAVAQSLACLAAADEEITSNVYQEDLWLMNRDSVDLTEFYQDNRDVFYYNLFNPITHSDYTGVYKVYYTSNNLEKLSTLEKKIVERFGDHVSVTYSLPYAMEVMSKGVNKGSALGQLLKHKIYPNDERSAADLLKSCIAFGDGDNDAQMLMMVGCGCVMANAQDRLLRVIPMGKDPHLVRVKSNAEDGVATKLAEVFQLTV